MSDFFIHLRQSKWEDKVIATKTRRVFDTREDTPERGLREWNNIANFLALFVLLEFINLENEVFVYNYIFNNLFYNILILPPTYLAFH